MRLLRTVAVGLLGTVWLAATLDAQATTDRTDWQGYSSATLKLNLPNTWEAALQYQARFVDNLREFRGSYVSVDASRDLTKRIKALGGYRLASVSNGTYHRFQLGVEASHKFGTMTGSVRLLAQHQQQNFDDADDDKDDYLRVRAEAKRDFGQALTMYGSIEPAFQFGPGYLIDSWRNRIGVKYKFVKAGKIDLFYIYRPDFAKSYNRTFHTVGIDVEWTVKR